MANITDADAIVPDTSRTGQVGARGADQEDSAGHRTYSEEELRDLIYEISAIRLAIDDHKIGEAAERLRAVQAEMRSRLNYLRGRVFDQDAETAHFPHQPGRERRQ